MIKYENGKIRDSFKDISVYDSYDVVVVGGGIAGVGAAIACGKRGLKTLIIEVTSALGGLATMGLVNIPLDFVSGIGLEMFDELKKNNGLWHRNTDVEKHKLVLDQMVKKYGCDVLLVTQVVDAIMEGNQIKGVIIQTKTGRRAVFAKGVIDCSGDSDAAYYAGAELMCGREEDNMSQACSLEFTMGGVNWDEYAASDLKKKDPKWVKRIAEDWASGKLTCDADNHLNWITHIPGRPEHCGMDEVSICLAHSRRCFPVDNKDLTRMYFEGRDQADILSKYIKENIPGFQNSFLVATGSLLGVRESRRVVGEYILTAHDLAVSRKFDDVICISTHGYDLHNYEGTGNIKWAPLQIDGKIQYVICNEIGFASTTAPPNGAPVVNIKGETIDNARFTGNVFYDIPYGCLVSKNIDWLLMAGRNLSSDVYAQSGSRLIMACLTMGEAAGVAMAISIKSETAPRNIDRITLQKDLIASKVNIGQNMREIPGLKVDSTENIDVYRNPEFFKEKFESSERKFADTSEFVKGKKTN